MNDPLSGPLAAIHAMLASGQRSLRLERHTLFLWGLTGAGLLTASESILTPEQIPSLLWRATAWLALLTVVLGGVAVIDWRLTRRVKHARDETWSFIHRQVLKLWWVLIGLAILTTFAMFFLGGGLMIYAVWMAMIGLGLYVHGLFSDALVEWIGATAILIAIASLVAALDIHAARWLAASLFGVGLPLLAVLADGPKNGGPARRTALVMLWLTAVLIPAAAIPRWRDARQDAVEAPSLSWRVYRAGTADLTGLRTLVIPAGTVIPLDLTLTGEVLRFDGDPGRLSLALVEPLTIRLRDGVPTGEVRLGDAPWRPAKAAGRLSIPQIGATLSPTEGMRFTLDAETHPIGGR